MYHIVNTQGYEYSNLIQAINDLTQRLSLETQLKDSLDEEVSALREEIERGQRSREQLLAELESKHEQEVQALVTEHAQKVGLAMVLKFPIYYSLLMLLRI